MEKEINKKKYFTINTIKMWIIPIIFLLISFVLWFVYVYIEKIIRIFIPFFIALIITYSLRPLVEKLQELKVPKKASIILLYSILIVCLLWLSIYITPQFLSKAQILFSNESLNENVKKGLDDLNLPTELKQSIMEAVNSFLNKIKSYMFKVTENFLYNLMNIANVLFEIFVSLIISYYLLFDGYTPKKYVLLAVPNKWRAEVVNILNDIDNILSKFIQGQFLISIIVGLMESIGLFLLNVKYPIVLGVIGGVSNLIPYFGPFIGAVPSVIIALVDSPIKAFSTVLLFVLVQQIDGAFISPRILKDGIGMHPLTTLFVVLVGGEFFGIFGMVILIPITAIIIAVYRRLIKYVV